MNLHNFFNPRSIAIIGASEHKEKVGYALLKNLADFSGKVIPINPKHSHSELFGYKTYSSVLDYNGQIDLAIIAIPAEFVAGAIEECGKKKIRSVIIVSAGFAEIGKIKEEKELVDISDRYDMDILGPNCFGVCNPYANLDLTFSNTRAGKGHVAFVSQSGALWSYVSDFAFGKFGFSKFASLGNIAELDFFEFINFLSKDKETQAIVLYIEKIKDGRRFIEAAKSCKKPIFAVKAGKSKEGEKAAISHTGSLATDYEIYKGAFKQAGVVLCESLLEAFSKATGRKFSFKVEKIIFDKKHPVSIITNAGGAGALAADYLSEAGFKINQIKDILGDALAEDYKNELEKHANAKNLLVLLTPQFMTEIEGTSQAIIDFKNKTNAKLNIVACFLGDKSVKQACTTLKNNKTHCFNTLEEFRGALNIFKTSNKKR